MFWLILHGTITSGRDLILRGLKIGNGFSYVRWVGFGWEWWNFYEKFSKDRYYGNINFPGGEQQVNFSDIEDALIIFISTKIKEGGRYFIGFYGNAKISSKPKPLRVNISALLPQEYFNELDTLIEEARNDKEGKKFVKDLEELRANNPSFVYTVSGEKKYSAVLSKPIPIKDTEIPIFRNIMYNVNKKMLARLLLEAKNQHKKLAEMSHSEEDRKNAEELGAG